jgi:hypothetical protein
MAKEKIPMTPAVRVLRSAKIAFTPHLYNYEDKGGTAVSARELGVDEHAVIKTLVMEDEDRKPCHGSQEGQSLRAGCRQSSQRLPGRRDQPLWHQA